jgi:hypothetical protein
MFKFSVALMAIAMMAGISQAAVLIDNDLEVEVEFLGATMVNGDTQFCYGVTDIGRTGLSNISFIFDCPPEKLVLLSTDPDTGVDIFGPGQDNPQVPDDLEPADGFSVKFDVTGGFDDKICFIFEGEIGVDPEGLVVFAKGGQSGAYATLPGPDCDNGGGGGEIPTPSALGMGLSLIAPMFLRRRVR